MLAKEQRIGAAILFGIALVIWMTVAFWPSHSPQLPEVPEPSRRTWEQRKDSMRRVDSIRYAQWTAEREQRYDSFRVADSLRRAAWKIERQQQYDSFRIADSLWRDSVGWRFPKRVKKDTILDLNHTDTAELQLIRGIGPFLARQIITYREQLGGYYSPAQLSDEKFSKMRLDTLLRHFTADTTAIRTLPVNRCSKEALQRHPYLRYAQASAIYSLRRKRVRLHSIDELRELPELTDEDVRRLTPYLRFD